MNKFSWCFYARQYKNLDRLYKSFGLAMYSLWTKYFCWHTGFFYWNIFTSLVLNYVDIVHFSHSNFKIWHLWCKIIKISVLVAFFKSSERQYWIQTELKHNRLYKHTPDWQRDSMHFFGDKYSPMSFTTKDVETNYTGVFRRAVQRWFKCWGYPVQYSDPR